MYIFNPYSIPFPWNRVKKIIYDIKQFCQSPG